MAAADTVGELALERLAERSTGYTGRFACEQAGRRRLSQKRPSAGKHRLPPFIPYGLNRSVDGIASAYLPKRPRMWHGTGQAIENGSKT
jgi:hypothetical protein